MRLQGGGKCAYCERMLESEEYGRVEQDVEHFRPKSSVRSWPAARQWARNGIPFTTVPPRGSGYYLLPYHLFNYAAVCKPCNSTLKRDYFPIAGNYMLNAENPAQIQGELPYLIYPIGSIDDPPEALIEFYGLTPRPLASAGHDRNRALVTIEFFQLGDENKRKNLFRERALLIIALFPQLDIAAGQGSTKEIKEAEDLVKVYTRNSAPHSNCSTSFVSLYRRNQIEAREIYLATRRFVTSIS